MEEFFDQEKALAKVYFLSENDEKNKLLVSEEKLLVMRKNHRKVYLLPALAHLKTEVKKYLLPVILGGIITPFAFLSYFINLFHPWIHLLSVLLGMLLFYIGWAGKSAFIVTYKNGDEDLYYLPSVSKNLLAFMDFVNSLLKNLPSTFHGNLVYFEVDQTRQIELFGELTDRNSTLFPLMGFTLDQLRKNKNLITNSNIVAINAQKAGREIRFSFDERIKQMRPTLDGPVLPQSKE